MSVVDHSEMQVWDNAAFDDGDASADSPASVKVFDSLPSDDLFKENLCPEFVNPGEKASLKVVRDLDGEIEEVERDILHLSEKLTALHLEKAERDAKMAETERRRGRLIPAKFMEQKVLQKQDTPVKVKLNCRGVSLCPAEIYSATMKSRPSLINRPEIDAHTPVLPLQSRRKSCFWNLNEIDELKVTKDRRKSMAPMSLSPNVGKIAPKYQFQKQALTSFGYKNGRKKEESTISSIQPKKLFKDAEKEKKQEREGPVRNRAKVVVKRGRVVASRYNKSAVSAARKRSFPENEKGEEAERVEKRRNSIVAGKVKKRWEIVPGDVVVYHSSDEEKAVEEDQEEEKAKAAKTPLTIGRAGELIRRSRLIRGVTRESLRDSGVAKRVAELEGRGRAGRFFMEDDEKAPGKVLGQALSFIEDDE